MRIEWSGRSFDYTEDDIAVVAEVMRSGDPLTQGPRLKTLEADFSKYAGSNHAFGVANCTNALDLSALLSQLSDADEVIVPAHTFCATAIPFARTGAKIVWADLDPETRVISPESILANLTSRTKVIVVVHLYGLMADMNAIMEIGRDNDCVVVEDCAQSLGAEADGKLAGSIGDLGTFSFQCQKNITTLGEGGILTVREESVAELVPGLRHNGGRPFPEGREDYWAPAMSNIDQDIDGVWPYNFCLGEAQAALGSNLLKRVDEMNEIRIARANYFRKEMSSYPELVFQTVPKGYKHVYHLLAAKYNGQDTGKTNHDLIRLMSSEYGVKCIVQYYPLYRYPLFQKMGFGEANCPHTDAFFDNMVSFPFHLWMSDEDFDYMIESTQSAMKRLRG
jgi:perosamine synthetase